MRHFGGLNSDFSHFSLPEINLYVTSYAVCRATWLTKTTNSAFWSAAKPQNRQPRSPKVSISCYFICKTADQKPVFRNLVSQNTEIQPAKRHNRPADSPKHARGTAPACNKQHHPAINNNYPQQATLTRDKHPRGAHKKKAPDYPEPFMRKKLSRYLNSYTLVASTVSPLSMLTLIFTVVILPRGICTVAL